MFRHLMMDRKMRGSWDLGVVAFLTVLVVGMAQQSVQYNNDGGVQEETVTACIRNNQVLNLFTLQCQECPDPNSSPTTTPSYPVSQRNGAGLSCECNEGYANSGGESQPNCAPCNSSQVVSLNGKFCLGCGTNAHYDSTSKICICDTLNSIQVENIMDNFVDCVQCATTQYATSDLEQCISCPDSRMEFTGGQPCQCPSGFLDVSGICISVDDLVPYQLRDSDIQVTFENSGQTVSSKIHSELLQRNWILCDASNFQNTTACESVANLCVLQLYDRQVGACDIYLEFVRTATLGQQQWSSWPQEIPWLYHEQGVSEFSDFRIPFEVAQDKMLEFTARLSTTRGVVLGTQPLDNLIQLCGGNDISWQYLGVDFAQSCVLDLSDLRAAVTKLAPVDETVFIELFINDSTTDLIYPIPVQINNYLLQGVRINTLRYDDASSQYFRRFFLVDESSGIGVDENGASIGNERIVRYASEITILFFIQKPGQGIRYPIMEVVYRDVYASELGSVPVPITFETRYRTSLDYYNLTLLCITVITVIVGFVRAGFVASTFKTRNFITLVDGRVLIAYVIAYCTFVGAIFFWVSIACSLYWFIAFNAQEQFQLTLPRTGNDDWIPGLLITGSCLKMLELLVMLYRASSADVFIIDWETPQRKIAVGDRQVIATTVWRKNLVANEWQELSSTRKAPVTHTILFALVVIIGFSFQDYSENDPRTAPSFQTSQHYNLRTSIIALSVLFASVVQYAFHALFYDRFVENAVLQFIDLCVISNLSVIVTDSKSHGYYIHGHSPHQQADVDMYSMMENLKKEAQDIAQARGLEESGDTFEVFIPQKLRDQWDSVLDKLEDSVEILGRVGFKTGDTDRMQNLVQANNTLNQLFVKFIEHSFRDIDFVIKKRGFVERLLEATPEIKRGIFFEDPTMRFTNLLMLGMEVKVLIAEVAIFVFWDYLITNYVVAGLLTVLLSWALSFWFSTRGASNIAKKTITDGRFLTTFLFISPSTEKK
eukprot:m.49409 g.49409  ORF g.49409 m.49409 type:complete len:998 (-) comp7449_c0_seq3:32-3025(-)